MARPNDPPNHNPMSPFNTPAGGMPQPVPMPPLGGHPYGPNPGYNAGGAPPKAKTGPSPAGMLHALKRRWVLATFLGGLIATVAACAVWFLMPAGKHQAKALVRLRQKTAEIGKTNEDFDTFRRDQMVILRTRDLITRTLAEPSVASLETIKTADDPVRWMEEGLMVKDLSPTTLAVTLPGDNPEDLVKILDMQVKKYIDDATTYDRRTRDDQMKKLENLSERLKGEIQAKERAINLMIDANQAAGGTGAAEKEARMVQELGKIEGDLFELQKEIQELESRITVNEKKVAAKRYDLNGIELQRNLELDIRIGPLMQERFIKKTTLERELEIAKLGPNDPLPPTILELKEQIAKLDVKLAEAKKIVEPEIMQAMAKVEEQRVRNKIADDKDKLEETKHRYAGRSQYRDQFQKGMTQAMKGNFNANALLKELEPQREALNSVERQRVQLQIEKDMDARVTLIEPAFIQMNLNAKQKTLLAIGAAVASFGFVIVLIGFLEWRTRRIDGVEQVVAELGMRVIGTVPSFPNKASLKAAEAAGNANWRFILNESINSTRTMLLHTARTQSMQVVMVTSATQGEGKTSLASQLGTSMATAGMRTLIVDCDLRNPSIHKLFDLTLQMGVSEVLCQEVDASDAVQPTAVPNLWVIPAGQCSTRVISALAQGQELESLFNRLRGQFDFIIVDSCPVLPVADALLIGQHVDGVVFSIMQDISQLPKVMVASEKLQQLNVPLLGAVVNNVSGGSAYYAYGYNYVKQLPA
ncbi:MAG: polysaccharide biosynthesis tyrosine autokinase [Gemmataceae bacterium]